MVTDTARSPHPGRMHLVTAAALGTPAPGAATTVALQTAIALLGLSLGAVWLARGRLMPLFRATTPGQIAGRLLLAGGLGLPLLGWLRLEGTDAGLYSNNMGVALFVAAVLVLCAGVAIWTALTVDAAGVREQLAIESRRCCCGRSARGSTASTVTGGPPSSTRPR